MLIVAAILALGVGYYVPQTFSSKPRRSVKADCRRAQGRRHQPSRRRHASKSGWAASAPGRVEPSGGEVRIGAQAPGRIAEVLVALNDKVAAGDLLVRLDDDELIGRVNSALAEAAIRKRERDNTDVSGQGPGAPVGRGRGRQRRAAAGADPRGGRSPAAGRAAPARRAKPTSTRRATP